MLRKGPKESATIFEIGTVKTGHDNNKWEVTENKNGIKRWVLFPAKKPFLLNTLYDKTENKGKDAWFTNLNEKYRRQIEKIRETYKDLQHLGLFVKEIYTNGYPNFLSPSDIISDFLDDHSSYENKPCCFISISLDERGQLDIGPKHRIFSYLINVDKVIAAALRVYFDEFNKNSNHIKISYKGTGKKIIFWYQL